MSRTVPPLRYDLQFLVINFAPKGPLRVLELGCGKGINAAFFHERGDAYTGIDRPPRTAPVDIQELGTFIDGDFCEALPPGPFDLVVERAAFVMNTDAALTNAIHLAHEALKPGGLLISADLYAAGNPMLPNNAAFRTFTLENLRTLFAPFETLHLAQRRNEPTFDFVGRKR